MIRYNIERQFSNSIPLHFEVQITDNLDGFTVFI